MPKEPEYSLYEIETRECLFKVVVERKVDDRYKAVATGILAGLAQKFENTPVKIPLMPGTQLGPYEREAHTELEALKFVKAAIEEKHGKITGIESSLKKARRILSFFDWAGAGRDKMPS